MLMLSRLESFCVIKVCSQSGLIDERSENSFVSTSRATRAPDSRPSDNNGQCHQSARKSAKAHVNLRKASHGQSESISSSLIFAGPNT